MDKIKQSIDRSLSNLMIIFKADWFDMEQQEFNISGQFFNWNLHFYGRIKFRRGFNEFGMIIN